MLTGKYLEGVKLHFEEEKIRNILYTRDSAISSIKIKNKTVNCPICNSTERESLIDSGVNGALGRCKDCNLIYAYRRCTKEVLYLMYKYYVPSLLMDDDVREEGTPGKIKEINEDLDWLECYSNRGNLLDVGASSGDFLAYARVRGWKVKATELSDFCADFIDRILNMEVFLGNILDIELEENEYSAITLRHSIEHLREPIEELKKLNSSLKENGILFITTPEHAKDVEFIKENHMMPLHIVNYTKETLDILLEKTGFKMISYESIPSHTDIDNMRVVAIKNE